MVAGRISGLGAAVLVVGFASLTTPPIVAGEPASSADLVRIGMVGSLFRDVPESMAAIMAQPFNTLMHSQTGLNGEIVRAGDADNLGRQLAADNVQLAVFHGVEFGWARQKHPDLRPLMIAVNQSHHLHAHLLVRAGDQVKGFADLKGKTLALPRRSREHCHLFVERHCQKCGRPPQKHFKKITNPANAEDAMDDVVDGVVQAAVIDGLALDCYKRRKPGRFAKLKIAVESEVFPASVIAYHPGAVDETILQRFRDGMVNANKTLLGRQLLNLWRLTGFEPIPDDYEQTLTEIVKAYPPPKADQPK